MKIAAVEYNAWLSMIYYLAHTINENIDDYFVNTDITIDVIPAYPKDLTRFRKPSIIVQKHQMQKSSIGMGNVVGDVDIVDSVTGEISTYDISGKLYTMWFSVLVCGRDNTECSLLTDMINDIVFNDDENMSDDIPIYEFRDVKRSGTDAPLVQVNTASLDDSSDTISLASNENKDYTNMLSFQITLISKNIDMDADMVDLSKPIEFIQTIRR